MLYQKLLMGNKPYFLAVGCAKAFEVHRHPEIELSFCLDGSYDIICDNRKHSLSAGDLAVIPPMTAHEIPQNDPSGKAMTVELGYTFLGEYYETFLNGCAECRVYKKDELLKSTSCGQLWALIEETAALYSDGSVFGELLVKGNLYKISALLYEMLNSPESVWKTGKKYDDIKKIDKALEIMYNSYYEPLDIETVSNACGYSKSNFCKIFKSITGDTFHNTLNRHRVEIACILLRESNDSVEKIAQETGFYDIKTFCRVFKRVTGKSAREYRKSHDLSVFKT